MMQTFGSTCHGAGRARSRNNSRNSLTYTEVLNNLKAKGISIRCHRQPQQSEKSILSKPAIVVPIAPALSRSASTHFGRAYEKLLLNGCRERARTLAGLKGGCIPASAFLGRTARAIAIAG